MQWGLTVGNRDWAQLQKQEGKEEIYSQGAEWEWGGVSEWTTATVRRNVNGKGEV